MGLDIYLHKVKVGNDSKAEFKSKGFDNAREIADNANREALKRAFKRVVSALEKADDMNELYDKKVRSLLKYFSYPQYYLRKIGVGGHYGNNKYEITIEPTTDIFNEGIVNEIIEKSWAPYIAYWRKVNFIYAYFDSRGLLDHDSECAWADREELEDILSRCENVLKEKDPTLLPTQSGFFFGSTDYNEWYYYDVRETKKQLKKVLKSLKDDEVCWFRFSW